MKTVNVNVMIQLDIPTNGDQLTNVQNALDFINVGLMQNSDENNGMQIFVNSINNSDILNTEEEFEIGDSVEVPEPDNTYDDMHNHSFVGRIVGFRNNYAQVEDLDGECWEIETFRLTKEE